MEKETLEQGKIGVRAEINQDIELLRGESDFAAKFLMKYIAPAIKNNISRVINSRLGIKSPEKSIKKDKK